MQGIPQILKGVAMAWVWFVVAVLFWLLWARANAACEAIESDLARAESRVGRFKEDVVELSGRNRMLAFEIVSMQRRLDDAAALVSKLIPVVADEVGVEKGKAKLTEAEVDEAFAYANQLDHQRT